MIRAGVLLTVMIGVLALAARGEAGMSPDAIDQTMQAYIAAKKTDVHSRAVMLPRAEADAFWQVYRDYEREREQLDARTVGLVERYRDSYRRLDDATAQVLLGQAFELHEQRLMLIRKYAAQLQTRLPMRQVAGFVLTEFQLLGVLDLERTADLGLIR